MSKKPKLRKAMKTTKESNFWTINLGHLIVLVSYLLTGAYYVGHFNSEMIQIKTGQTMLTEKISTIEKKINTLDTEGSARQRVTQETNEKTLNSHDTRITKLEELAPKISEMAANIKSMSEDMTFFKGVFIKDNTLPNRNP